MMTWIRLLILVILFAGCAVTESGYSHLLKEVYIKPRPIAELPFTFSLYRQNDSLCQLFYRAESQSFLSKRETNDQWYNTIKVDFLVQRNQFAGKQFFSQIEDYRLESKSNLNDSFEFYLPINKDLFYELKLIDENKHVYRIESSWWNRKTGFLKEDFLIRDTNNEVLTERIFDIPVTIQSNRWKDSLLLVRKYSDLSNVAELPYAQGSLKNKEEFGEEWADTILLAELNTRLQVDFEEGFYKVNLPEDIYSKNNFYFSMNEKRPIIDALIYLSDEKEGRTSLQTWTTFWLKASGGEKYLMDKLIKEFEERVRYTNQNFASYKEGWKTDKGMLYIVYGKPDRVLTDTQGESWTYGLSEVNSQLFLFRRDPHNLHPNDWELERSFQLKERWDASINRWKNGWVNIN
jgi:GWxTD domain-containing protein